MYEAEFTRMPTIRKSDADDQEVGPLRLRRGKRPPCAGAVNIEDRRVKADAQRPGRQDQVSVGHEGVDGLVSCEQD